MTPGARAVPITEMQERVAVARALVERELLRRLPDEETSLRFHREWSGGWRVRVEIGRPVRGRLDFVLFETPEGAVIALAHPMPDAWRDAEGTEASDGSRWRWGEDGFPEPVG